MDPSLKEMSEFFVPKVNPLIMNGYVCHEMKSPDPRDAGYDQKGMENRVDSTLRKAFNGLLDGRLIYEGFELCTPQETFDFETRTKNNRRVFELARSDIYLVRINLSYKTTETLIVPIPDIFLYLPDPGPGGLMEIGGPLFQLIPIVSDKVISPESDYLFVRLEQYKMKFYKNIDYPIIANGETIFSQVYWANIYMQKTEKTKAALAKAKSTLAHYLFARLGVTGTFQKYLNCTPVIGTAETVNKEAYPDSDWVICETAYSVIHPPTLIGKFYKPTKAVIAIPRNKWNDQSQSLIHSLFYIADAFSEALKWDQLDNPSVWRLTLGYIISDPRFSYGKILGVVEEHFSSTDTYMDDLSVEKLAEKGYNVRDFTDLLALLATRYKELYSDGGQNQVVYGKYLDTIREMLFPITYEIYNTKYQLLKQASKGPLQFGTVKDIFVRRFKPRRFFQVTSKGIVAEVVNFSGDHKYFKFTARLSQQEATPGSRTSKGRKTLNSNHYLNTSMTIAGSILFLSKKKPVPMSHANMFMVIDPYTGTILENDEFKGILETVDAMLLKKS